MKFFTRQWWFIESVELDFDNESFFQSYEQHVHKLSNNGVPILPELFNPCRLHDHVITRYAHEKQSLIFVLRDPEHWKPYLLKFNSPVMVRCTNQSNGDEHTSFDLSELIGAGIGYCEFDVSNKGGYRFSMIFDCDFSIDIELESEIVFHAISSDLAADHE